MMRRLVLMRHAKSSWKHDGLGDHARPLNKRGQRSAPAVAARLAELGWVPDLVCSSDAARTRETWSLMAPVLPAPVQEIFTRALYLADLEELRRAAAAWPETAGTVLALGHNPGWEDALSLLSESPQTMTTGNAGLLEIEAPTWSDALRGPMRLVDVIRPRDLLGE